MSALSLIKCFQQQYPPVITIRVVINCQHWSCSQLLSAYQNHITHTSWIKQYSIFNYKVFSTWSFNNEHPITSPIKICNPFVEQKTRKETQDWSHGGILIQMKLILMMKISSRALKSAQSDDVSVSGEPSKSRSSLEQARYHVSPIRNNSFQANTQKETHCQTHTWLQTTKYYRKMIEEARKYVSSNQNNYFQANIREKWFNKHIGRACMHKQTQLIHLTK